MSYTTRTIQPSPRKMYVHRPSGSLFFAMTNTDDYDKFLELLPVLRRHGFAEAAINDVKDLLAKKELIDSGRAYTHAGNVALVLPYADEEQGIDVVELIGLMAKHGFRPIEFKEGRSLVQPFLQPPAPRQPIPRRGGKVDMDAIMARAAQAQQAANEDDDA